jgi:hypothetical protein
MRFTGYSFGSTQVDDVTYHDLILDRGKIRKRRRPHRRSSVACPGTPPLSVTEISRRDAAADGALPVMQQVRDEARRRKVDLVVQPTA